MDDWRAELNVLIFLLILTAIVTYINPFFITPANIRINLQQASIYAVLAIGETFVLLVGGIDLSAGAQITAANVLIAYLVSTMHLPFLTSLVLIYALAIAVGLGQGIFSVTFSPPFPFVAPSFIVSLAVNYILSGAMLVMTLGFPIYINSRIYSSFGTMYGFLGIPNPVWILLGVLAFSIFLLTQTKAGRHIYAIGGSAEVARLSGVNVTALRLFCFAFAAAMYATVGLEFGSIVSEGTVTIGPTYLIPAIAAPFLGGVSLAGGEGSVVGATLGAIVVYIVSDILITVGISSYYNDVIVGVIFFAVVLFDFVRRKRAFR